MSLNLIRFANFVDGMASVSLVQPDTFSARLKKTMRNTGLVRRIARIGDEAALHRVMRDRILGQAFYTLLAFSLLGTALWLAGDDYGDLRASLVAMLIPAVTVGCQIASRRLNAKVAAIAEDSPAQPC